MIRVSMALTAILVLLFAGCDSIAPVAKTDVVFPVQQGDRWGVIDSSGSKLCSIEYNGVAWTNAVAGSTDILSGLSRELGQESSLLFSESEWLFLKQGTRQSISPKLKHEKGVRYLNFTNLGDSLFTIWDVAKPRNSQTDALTFDPTNQWKAHSGVLAFGKVTEGLVPIVRDGKYGFADRSGEIKIRPQFQDAHSFSEGVAAVKDEKGWTYINKSGAQALAVYFDSHVTRFDKGVALVTHKDEKFAIDRAGRRLATFEWKPAIRLGSVFSEGLIRSKTEAGWGFMDANGVWKIEPKFALVTDFSEELAGAKLGGRPSDSGYIDWTGEFVVVVPDAKALGEFHHGLAWVETKDGTVGYVDKKGEWRWKYNNALKTP